MVQEYQLLPKVYEGEYWEASGSIKKKFQKQPSEECENCGEYDIQEIIEVKANILYRIINGEKEIIHEKICNNCGRMFFEETWQVEEWIKVRLNGSINRNNTYISATKIQAEIKE